MNWFIHNISTSIGKKLLMAITGLCFCCFLLAHLAGNLTLYFGKDAFNAYAEHVHALGPLLTIVEWGLLIFALVHVLTGLTLFYQNLRARPSRYAVNKSAGGRSIGSATMPYTGFILLLFVIYHLMDFHFVDKSNTTIYQIVSDSFSNPVLMLLYIIAVIIAGIHVSHGLWSAFQTIGANHPKYTPLIKATSLVFGLIVGIGFGFIPIFISIII